MDIIITDLTRFVNPDIVCTAGINPETNQCIRPMPYLPTGECQRLNILPGAILRGNFVATRSEKPHSEDRRVSGRLSFVGPCKSEKFRKILEATLSNSVEEGFGIALQEGQKHIPMEGAPEISIITLRVEPWELEIVADRYKEGRIKAIFTDGAGMVFRYLPITDLGFYNYAMREYENNRIDELNQFIYAQNEVFLRLGLSRAHRADDGRNGFWLQVNGIYTFPEYLEDIRSH
jgi:hypothetical protein